MSDLPFLKKKNRMPSGSAEVRQPDQSNDEIIMEHIGQELMDALERRDIKSIREAIHALANLIKDNDSASTPR